MAKWGSGAGGYPGRILLHNKRVTNCKIFGVFLSPFMHMYEISLYIIGISVNPKMFDSDFLQNGVQPFLDNKSYFITDIPLRYHGRRMLRSLAQPNIDSFTIDLNVPAILYIASPADESLPLEPTNDAPWTAHETHETMTLLSGVDASGRALEAKPLSIRFISLRTAGGVKCKVRHTAIPFIIFVEPHKEEAFSCDESDAEEDVVSLVGGPAFAECDATSEQPDGFDCFSGLNGKHMDRPFGTWKTKGGGVGESITVRFRHLVQLTHFRFKPLDDQLLWPSEVTLSYSGKLHTAHCYEFNRHNQGTYFSKEEGDEGSETFLMRHSNSLEHNTYKLRAPVITQYVKAEISQMYVNGMESGGSFEFLGSICTTQVRAKGISSLRKILIEASRVFGSSSFAPESTVCASGVFAGICKAEVQAECSLLVTVGGAKNTFSKDTKHYIEAAEHGPSDASYTLAKAPCEGKEEEQPSYFFTFGAQSAPEVRPSPHLRRSFSLHSHTEFPRDGSLMMAQPAECEMEQNMVCTMCGVALSYACFTKTGLNQTGWLRPARTIRAPNDQDSVAGSGVVFPSPSNYACQLGEGSATVEVTQRLIDFASVCKNATCGAEPTLLLSASVSYVGPLPGNSETEED
ncbi:PA14 domain-containing protein [Cyclospora cayetanensis]|uniref:PA14 domain-containing protein n=1 Tax=Cyclospora cayetanensis TaxID=88456 RepID=A0A1D3D1C8_9EIME|nr:PA14 domain-containing protein [Cyclospora cayetanensis]